MSLSPSGGCDSILHTSISSDSKRMPSENGRDSIDESGYIVDTESGLVLTKQGPTAMAGSRHADLEAVDTNGSSEQQPLLDSDRIVSHPSESASIHTGPRRERLVAYFCFLILGATVLLPWNLLIVVTPYFSLRLAGSSFASTAPNSVALTFTLANLLFLLLATRAQKIFGFHGIEGRIYKCVAVIVGLVLVLLATTVWDVLGTSAFFVLLMLISICGAGVSAILQSSSAALASVFDDSFFLQGTLSGQGAIGFSVALTQFLAALRSSKHAPSPFPTSNEPPSSLTSDLTDADEQLVASTRTFFAICLLFTLIAAIASWLLTTLTIYKRSIEGAKQVEQESKQHREETSLLAVDRKIRGLGLALAFIYVITIGLFPGITASVEAIGKEGRLSSNLLWIPLGFVVFNTGDWIGRALPGFHQLVFSHKQTLIGGSLLRAVFIPLLLFCNVQVSADRHRIPLISSDTAYLLILILFAISNGYLTSLLMMRAISDETLQPDEVDIASSIMLVYLTAGLAIGAMFSFVLLAFVS